MSYQILTVKVSDRLAAVTNASRRVNRVRLVRTTQLRTAWASSTTGSAAMALLVAHATSRHPADLT